MTTKIQQVREARQPNAAVGPVPADYIAVPDEVRAASDKLVEARRRYSDALAEYDRSDHAVREAQAADETAIREALDAGKAAPKSKAAAAVEKAAETERQLEPARTLAIEAENEYLNTCRSHRAEWMAALQDAQGRIEARQERAIGEARAAKLDLHNAEIAYSEIEKLGDPSELKRPEKANMYAVLGFRSLTKLDADDERRLAEFREGRDSIQPQSSRMMA
jgi:hypothetical protein